MSENVVTRYGMEVDLSIEGKTACPKCKSQGGDWDDDNLHVYGLDDQGNHKGAFCHSCEYTIPSVEWLLENGEIAEEEWEDILGKEFNEEVHLKLKERTGIDSKNYRSIPTEISKWFGVRYKYSEADGSIAESYYPCTIDGVLSGYKVRKHPKDFQNPGPYGETGQACDLFGQHRFKTSSGRYVVITSGEHDQLAAFTMLKQYNDKRETGFADIPVVSPTIGESGAYKQIQKQYAWLNGFERIIYIPDPDKAGKQALEKVSKIVPKGKLFVMTLPLKDPNEMLEKGRNKEFIDAFYKAKAYVPDGIVGSGSLMEKIKEAAVVPRIPLPSFMHEVQDLMAGGIPLGVIVNLGSASGTGKSTIIDECVYYWVHESPHKVGVVSLESDCAQYGTKLLSRKVGRKIDLIGNVEEKVAFLNDASVQQASDDLFYNADGTHRWHLIDERDGGLDSLKEVIEDLIISCGCKVIILDPLQDILDGLSNDEQAKFMKWQKGMVKSHGVTFINVNHVRKSSGGAQANSTGATIHEEDFQGSSSIFKSSACNLLFTRNKEAENEVERNTTLMKMTKCRWTGRTAPAAGQYYYDNATHTLHDLKDYLRAHPELLATPQE